MSAATPVPWSDPDAFLYSLDAEDRLVAVNERRVTPSDSVGRDLGIGAGDTLVGRSVWELLSDFTTQHFFRLLFGRARLDQRAITLPYRCDTPTLVRHFELRIVPDKSGALSVLSRSVLEIARPAVDLLDATVPRSHEWVRLCGWCKRLDLDGRWEEIEVALACRPAWLQWPPPNVTHGICDDCERSISAAMERREE